MASEQSAGDPLTLNPRLVCEECETYVYVTWPRRTEEGFYHFECKCRALTDRGDPPDSWYRYGEADNGN